MNEDEDIQLAKIVDYFSDEELDEHLFSVSVTFRSSFGTRNVPLKAANWDGRPSSADEIRKSRPETDKVDCYRVLLPSGQTIEKQIHSAAVFAHDGQSMYAIQPREIEENNLDPFLKLVPNRRNPNMRLILFWNNYHGTHSGNWCSGLKCTPWPNLLVYRNLSHSSRPKSPILYCHKVPCISNTLDLFKFAYYVPK